MKRISILALSIILATLVAGCTPKPAAPPVVPPVTTESVTPTATPEVTSTPSASAVMVRVYFAHDEKMQPVLRELPAGTKATLKAALEALMQGPNASETAAGMFTLVPEGSKLLGVSISGKTATIDLNSAFESGGGTMSVATRLDQLIYTATQFPTVKDVKLKIDGKAITIFSGEGVMVDKPQTRADATYSTPAIFVDDPAWQGTVKKGMVARGTADVFEAVFRMQLRDSSGALVFDKAVKASSGTGTRGTWAQTLTWTTAKAGIGELKVFAESAKDGSPIDVVTIPVLIAE
jgi:hypothetical protein